jgi:hypothetical protein
MTLVSALRQAQGWHSRNVMESLPNILIKDESTHRRLRSLLSALRQAQGDIRAFALRQAQGGIHEMSWRACRTILIKDESNIGGSAPFCLPFARLRVTSGRRGKDTSNSYRM